MDVSQKCTGILHPIDFECIILKKEGTMSLDCQNGEAGWRLKETDIYKN